MSELFSDEMFPFYATMCFVYGLLFGSFFNVCIYRIPLGQSINRPRRSFCFACGSPVRWRDNIPLVSYLALGGRCRDCGAPFSVRYFLVELLTGALFLAVFLAYGYTLTTLAYLVFTATLIIATFTDLDHWIIPDSMSLGGAAVGVALSLLAPLAGEGLTAGLATRVSGPFPGGVWWGPGANAVVGASFGFGLLWGVGFMGRMMFRKEAMGMGDLKLFASIGAFLGWLNCLAVLMAASLLGTLVGVPMLVREGMRRRAAARRAQRAAEARSEAEGTDDVEGAGDGASAALVDDPAGRYDLAALTGPGDQAQASRHLPFGPSIAVAAFLVMLFHQRLAQYADAYFGVDIMEMLELLFP